MDTDDMLTYLSCKLNIWLQMGHAYERSLPLLSLFSGGDFNLDWDTDGDFVFGEVFWARGMDEFSDFPLSTILCDELFLFVKKDKFT